MPNYYLATLLQILGLLSFTALVSLGVVASVDAAGPDSQKPNAGALTEGYLHGLDDNGVIKYKTSDAGTTPDDLTDTDPLTTDQRNNQHLQIATVINLDNEANICVHAMDWGDTCSTETAACAASSNARRIIPAGQSRELVFDGTVDLCLVSDTSEVIWQAEVTARQAGAR